MWRLYYMPYFRKPNPFCYKRKDFGTAPDVYACFNRHATFIMKENNNTLLTITSDIQPHLSKSISNTTHASSFLKQNLPFAIHNVYTFSIFAVKEIDTNN